MSATTSDASSITVVLERIDVVTIAAVDRPPREDWVTVL